MTRYEYTVEFVGNYWTITTQVGLEFEDTIGNLSDEAREMAIESADEALQGEIGIAPLNFSHSVLVTLNLDGEDVQL
jgi:hypothetical protein